MNLPEAIEVLEEQVHQCSPITPSVVVKAIRLSIEAAKRIIDGRIRNYDYFSQKLPGETDD